MRSERNVMQMSNELEFSLDGIEARELVGAVPGLVHEVNPKDIVELNVSLAPDISGLNRMVDEQVRGLIATTESRGGRIYGGASLLANVSSVEPARYRTTSISDSCGRGFLDITSQQIVLGVGEEQLGFDLYNFFRQINPVLLALSASSPFRLRNGSIEDTDFASRRIEQYERLCRYFPGSMWREMPEIHSLEEYSGHLRAISDEVNRGLLDGIFDANWEELKRVRTKGSTEFSHYPFSRLEPHQIYWFIRVRPDHRNIESGGSSLFSLELRVPDIPTTIQRMQMINSFVVGLAYYIADNGDDVPTSALTGSFGELRNTAARGLDAEIGGVGIRYLADSLRGYSARGLESRGYTREAQMMVSIAENILHYGNDASLIRELNPMDPTELRGYLITRLREGELWGHEDTYT